MEQNSELKIFEDKKIRVKWDEGQERWYFSVVDVIAILTDNDYQAGKKILENIKNEIK